MGNNCGLDEDVKKIKTGIVKIIKITLYFNLNQYSLIYL